MPDNSPTDKPLDLTQLPPIQLPSAQPPAPGGSRTAQQAHAVAQHSGPAGQIQAPQAPQNPQVQALLQQLDPITQPGPVGLWPLAPGWWLVIVLCTCVLTAAIYQWLKFLRKNAYRKSALRQLNALKSREGSDAEFLLDLNALLKQVMLTAFPARRAQIAKFHGQSWLNELNRHSPREVFTLPQCHVMVDGLYQVDPNCNRAELCQISEQWIKQHRVTKTKKVADKKDNTQQQTQVSEPHIETKVKPGTGEVSHA